MVQHNPSNIAVFTPDAPTFRGPVCEFGTDYIDFKDGELSGFICGEAFRYSIKLPAGWHNDKEYLSTKFHYFHKLLGQFVLELQENTCLSFTFSRRVSYFGLFLSSLFGVGYDISIPAAPNRVGGEDYSFLLGAEEVFYETEKVRAELAAKIIAPLPTKSVRLEGEALLERHNEKRMLLVGYFTGPCTTVGVLRPNYWLQRLSELSEGRWGVDVATAVNWSSQGPAEGFHYVRDSHFSVTLPSDGPALAPAEKWKPHARKIEEERSRSVNTIGYYWRYDLEAYFDSVDVDGYDVVVITGNPFCYFDFSSYCQRKWGAKVVLDYRDPFSNNPRFKYTNEVRNFARFLEQGYNFQADSIVVVNDDCVGLLENASNVNVEVIRNGFDERVSEQVEMEGLGVGPNLVHAGSIYYYGSPENVLDGLSSVGGVFHHIGKSVGIEAGLLEHPAMRLHGVCDYPATLSKISGADCGVVFVSEAGFETPTKIYDYIAMGLDILICTQGPLNYGALSGLLEEYPGVYWCENSRQGVVDFLANYQASKASSQCRLKYSRRDGALKLLSLVDSL